MTDRATCPWLILDKCRLGSTSILPPWPLTRKAVDERDGAWMGFCSECGRSALWDSCVWSWVSSPECVCSMNYTCGETSQPGATTPEPFLRSLVSASALWGSVILAVRPRWLHVQTHSHGITDLTVRCTPHEGKSVCGDQVFPALIRSTELSGLRLSWQCAVNGSYFAEFFFLLLLFCASVKSTF